MVALVLPAIILGYPSHHFLLCVINATFQILGETNCKLDASYKHAVGFLLKIIIFEVFITKVICVKSADRLIDKVKIQIVVTKFRKD